MAQKPKTSASKDTSSGDDNPSFETALHGLEEVVEQLEGGDLSLEASLALYERGVTLSAHCQKALDGAEQKVKLLNDNGTGDDASLVDFESDEANP